MRVPHIKDHREGLAQKSCGISNNPKNVESQFNGRLSVEDSGSNLENRLVIIVS